MMIANDFREFISVCLIISVCCSLYLFALLFSCVIYELRLHSRWESEVWSWSWASKYKTRFKVREFVSHRHSSPAMTTSLHWSLNVIFVGKVNSPWSRESRPSFHDYLSGWVGRGHFIKDPLHPNNRRRYYFRLAAWIYNCTYAPFSNYLHHSLLIQLHNPPQKLLTVLHLQQLVHVKHLGHAHGSNLDKSIVVYPSK